MPPLDTNTDRSQRRSRLGECWALAALGCGLANASFAATVGAANAKKTLEAGFTTIRNVGSDNFDDVAIKQGIDTGHIPGPRIVPATYAIGATGGHCDSTEFPPVTSAPSPWAVMETWWV